MLHAHPWSNLMLSASVSTLQASPMPHSIASSSSSWKAASVASGNTSLNPDLQAHVVMSHPDHGATLKP